MLFVKAYYALEEAFCEPLSWANASQRSTCCPVRCPRYLLLIAARVGHRPGDVIDLS